MGRMRTSGQAWSTMPAIERAVPRSGVDRAVKWIPERRKGFRVGSSVDEAERGLVLLYGVDDDGIQPGVRTAAGVEDRDHRAIGFGQHRRNWVRRLSKDTG